VLEGERTFFFANWIFEFNVRQMEEASDSIGADASSVKERALASRMRQAVRTLRENLTINNGTFYLDAKGHLGGVQRVRIGNLSRVVDTVNDGLHAFIELRLLSHKLDPEEQPLYRRALTDPSAFLTVKGNRLTFRFPMSEAAFRREIAKPETDDADLRRLRQAEIHVTHADGEFRVIIGREDERVTTISLDTFEKPYRPNVLRHLETKGTPIPATFHPARAASEYLGPR
jgi:mRNA-degrading endonuclease RelE of RelBE toxin-antitoxin system